MIQKIIGYIILIGGWFYSNMQMIEATTVFQQMPSTSTIYVAAIGLGLSVSDTEESKQIIKELQDIQVYGVKITDKDRKTK